MHIIDYIFFTIFINKPFLLEAKIDTGILLVIESSIQNQDYDILCALRDAVSNLTQEPLSLVLCHPGHRDKGEGQGLVSVTIIAIYSPLPTPSVSTVTTNQRPEVYWALEKL